jgi:CheY-like chemotaxis protein
LKTGSGVCILVAEDNAVNQKVAVRMLESLGYRADVAANGLEAVEALTRVPYAAILMDVQMPEMDGYAATAEIRKREGPNRRRPIIAMTANAMEGDRERALEAGMDDHVPKPVKPEVLDAVLKRWVDKGVTESGETYSDRSYDPAKASREGVKPPLDRDVLERLRELGGSELFSDLAETFLRDAPVRLVELRRAVEAGDAELVQRSAHALRGSSGSMGATQMARFCAGLQDAGARGDLAQSIELLGRLEVEFGRVRPALAAEASASSAG